MCISAFIASWSSNYDCLIAYTSFYNIVCASCFFVHANIELFLVFLCQLLSTKYAMTFINRLQSFFFVIDNMCIHKSLFI